MEKGVTKEILEGKVLSYKILMLMPSIVAQPICLNNTDTNYKTTLQHYNITTLQHYNITMFRVSATDMK
jgi:hypothetical protein